MGPEHFSLVGLVVGLAIGLLVHTWRTRLAARVVADANADERRQLAAERELLAHWRTTLAAECEAKAQEELRRQQAALEAELASQRSDLAREAKQLQADRLELADSERRCERRDAKLLARETAMGEREQSLDRKLELLDRRDTRLRELEAAVETRQLDLDARYIQVQQQEQVAEEKLAAVAGLTREEAREELLRRLDATLIEEQAERIARHEKEVTTRAKELSVEVISRAIQRYAAEHTADTSITKIKLADEELKGRIIGKDGRNIKAFEQATGVDLIVDETPGTITVSCFSGLRREIARRTLELLLEDGRIHPARIEEVLAKVQQDLDREVVKLGEDAAYACDVSGLHPQLIKLLGKLQYRTSYGQNVLKHTQEVAFLCGALAADIGLDPKLGRRCGLLHDIGKAIDHEQEGSHPELGYEALKRYGETEIVANAALAHHEGHEVLSAYTTLAAAADAISAARPGARSENAERYIKRLEQLEDIACSFKGVQKAYAIQAGRELRVIVNGHTLHDSELGKVARDIARRIEEEVAYPGEVRVTLIREMRQVAVAR